MGADGSEIEPSGTPRASVAGGVLCISCGYDLRGLPLDANCPECGTPAERSLHGDQLSSADATWLGRIVRGQRLLAWGWLLILLAPASMIVMVFAGAFASALEPLLFAALAMVTPIIGVVGLLLTALGIIFVTIQDPRETLQESTLSPRRLARAGMVGAVTLYITALPLGAIISEAAEIARPILLLSALVMFTIGIVSFLRWLATLLLRVPDAKYAKEAMQMANFLRWGLPLAIVLVTFLPRPGRGPAPGTRTYYDIFTTIAGCTGAILMLLLIAKCIAAGILFFKASGQFQTCLARARVDAEMAESLALSQRSSAGPPV